MKRWIIFEQEETTIMGKRIIICATAAVMFCLCGCKDNNIDTTGLEKLKDRMEQQAANDKPEETEDKTEDIKEEETEEEITEGLFAKAFADGQVENNGGLFVRVGNRVYFRVYDKRALALTTMGDSFIDEVRADCPSKLMYFDLDKDETVEACTVAGIGPLYATTDGICIMSYPDGYPSTTLVDENGNINETYLPANITGVSPDGRDITVGESDENDDIIPVLYRDGVRIGETDEPDNASVSESEVYLSNGTFGDLVCRASSGEEKVIYKDYIYDPGEGALFREAVEAGACFDNESVFLIRVSADRAPDEDMGGRMAFDLKSLEYECYRFDDAHQGVNGAQYYNLARCESTGWASGDIEYDRLIGSWECYSANVEGFDYQVYKESPTVEVITFNEDGSGVISHVNRSSGEKISADRKIHQAQQEEPEYAPDYAFYYETDDPAPEKIGICYLTHGRLGIYHLYHYDGTSTGWYMGSYRKAK